MSDELPVTMSDLADEIRDLRKTQETLLGLLAEIRDQIEPMLNSLKDSPILRMLGVK